MRVVKYLIDAVLISLAFPLLLACAAPHPPQTAQPPISVQTLSEMDEHLAAQALGLSGIDWGYILIDPMDGAILETRGADKGYPPASTAKLPTMIAALGILGPNHRFTTQLLARGTLKGGVLSGDLVLAGDGDPLLSAGDLRALAVRMKDIGITRLEGRFLFASALPVFAEVEAAQPPNAPYNQGVGGLNIEFNRVLAIRDDLASVSSAYTSPPEARSLVPGLPDTGPALEELPIRAPGKMTALLLRRFAIAEGISLPHPEPGPPPQGAIALAQIRSQPLIEIARAGLEYSNNMVAEVVGLAASRKSGSSAETLRGSADMLGVWLERHVDGLHGFATALANHSGLSTESRMTPRQMAMILKYALDRRFDGWRFDSLLTPGGIRDTFRGRFRDPESTLRVWAKSGTMRYIKGLAGYLDAHSGKRLIFALFVHDAARRDLLERDPARYGTASRVASSNWRRSTDDFEAALISRWLRDH